MLFSVEDMARCQAVCSHNRDRVAALIKLFIHIIILRRIQTSQTKLFGIGDFCAVGPRGDLLEPQKMSSQPDDGCLQGRMAESHDKWHVVHFYP